MNSRPTYLAAAMLSAPMIARRETLAGWVSPRIVFSSETKILKPQKYQTAVNSCVEKKIAQRKRMSSRPSYLAAAILSAPMIARRETLAGWVSPRIVFSSEAKILEPQKYQTAINF
ncbi:hypothetical protein CDAR_248441 [Caerostris darwini]|uniref:Secreted protein n=1 Tax=Caerostris darwini TaxID=1538125 RepID=A0AAV4NAH5_9ARAC|nr:hypothetical protein CDAR_248441 [Caerostris darwini]